jgi:hypothetical protein
MAQEVENAIRRLIFREPSRTSIKIVGDYLKGKQPMRGSAYDVAVRVLANAIELKIG